LLAGQIQNDAFAGKGWKEETAPAQKHHVLKTAAFGYLQALDILWHSSFQECCVIVSCSHFEMLCTSSKLGYRLQIVSHHNNQQHHSNGGFFKPVDILDASALHQPQLAWVPLANCLLQHQQHHSNGGFFKPVDILDASSETEGICQFCLHGCI